jgi:hypothetical protein
MYLMLKRFLGSSQVWPHVHNCVVWHGKHNHGLTWSSFNGPKPPTSCILHKLVICLIIFQKPKPSSHYAPNFACWWQVNLPTTILYILPTYLYDHEYVFFPYSTINLYLMDFICNLLVDHWCNLVQIWMVSPPHCSWFVLLVTQHPILNSHNY